MESNDYESQKKKLDTILIKNLKLEPKNFTKIPSFINQVVIDKNYLSFSEIPYLSISSLMRSEISPKEILLQLYEQFLYLSVMGYFTYTLSLNSPIIQGEGA